MMQNELDIVCDVSQRLDAAGIGYMLTGSMDINYFAQPRMTRDIDIVVALRREDAERVVKLFSPDYYISREAVDSSIAQQSLFNLIHNESVYKVDCIVRKETAYRLNEFNRRAADQNPGFRDLDREQGGLDCLQNFLGKRILTPNYNSRDVKNLVATGCDRRLHRTLDGRTRFG